MARSVLIVDDDPDIREALAEALGAQGHEATCVGTARAALEILHKATPSVLLLDLTLQGRDDGWELLRTKAADPAIARIPVIVMTGYTRLPKPVAGVFAVLHKPFEIEQLVRAIAAAPEPLPERMPLG